MAVPVLNQCNFCGSFEDPAPCPHCASLLCGGCRLGHVSVCVDLSKRRAAGAGATVRQLTRQHVEIPPLPSEEFKKLGFVQDESRISVGGPANSVQAAPLDYVTDPFAAAGVEFAPVLEVVPPVTMLVPVSDRPTDIPAEAVPVEFTPVATEVTPTAVEITPVATEEPSDASNGSTI